MSMRCLIVDDEPLATDVIEAHMSKLDDVQIVGKCHDGAAAFERLSNEEIDVVFLDIQMPGLTGLELAKIIKGTQVVFTTAYREYALDGYDLNVTDYLLKPISFDRFLQAVQKVRDNIIAQKSQGVDKDYLFFKQDKKMVRVVLDNILYIESLKDYIKIVTTEKSVVTHENISKVINLLPDYFLRIHRSFIVSLKKVEVFSAVDVELKGGHDIPIGKSYKEHAHKQLEAYMNA